MYYLWVKIEVNEILKLTHFISTAQDDVFEFPPSGRERHDLDGRAITLVTGSSRKISVRLQRSTTSQATQTDPMWPDSGWSDTGSHTFPKMKCKFYSKSTKNKGFAKWENEKPNMHQNMDIMEVQIMEQLQDHNGTEAKELSSTEVYHIHFNIRCKKYANQ